MKPPKPARKQQPAPVLASVPRLWPDSTVVCIASGPSLTPEDVAFVRGKAKVIVVNTSYLLCPWADVLYAADFKWWHWMHDRVKRQEWAAFDGLRYSLTKESERYGVTVLRRGSEDGLSLKPTHLSTGKNSGYQAINLAVLLGASRVVLLGYDMQPGPKDEEHWHADHPNKSRSPYARFQSYFPTLVQPLAEAGVSIVNCTRRTALECFPRQVLRDALAETAVAA